MTVIWKRTIRIIIDVSSLFIWTNRNLFRIILIGRLFKSNNLIRYKKFFTELNFSFLKRDKSFASQRRNIIICFKELNIQKILWKKYKKDPYTDTKIDSIKNYCNSNIMSILFLTLKWSTKSLARKFFACNEIWARNSLIRV